MGCIWEGNILKRENCLEKNYTQFINLSWGNIQPNWLGGSDGTPRVLGLTPHGSEFQAVVKKIPSSVPCQSIGLRTGPGRWSSHTGYGTAM